MKSIHYQDKILRADSQHVAVHFEFTHLTARAVSVAGNFNDWDASSKSMHPTGKGRWVKEAFLPPGDYQYLLVVDGQWLTDPLARESVSNPYGGRNSILHVIASPEAVHREDAENLPMKNTNKPKTKKI